MRMIRRLLSDRGASMAALATLVQLLAIQAFTTASAGAATQAERLTVPHILCTGERLAHLPDDDRPACCVSSACAIACAAAGSHPGPPPATNLGDLHLIRVDAQGCHVRAGSEVCPPTSPPRAGLSRAPPVDPY